MKENEHPQNCTCRCFYLMESAEERAASHGARGYRGLIGKRVKSDLSGLSKPEIGVQSCLRHACLRIVQRTAVEAGNEGVRSGRRVCYSTLTSCTFQIRYEHILLTAPPLGESLEITQASSFQSTIIRVCIVALQTLTFASSSNFFLASAAGDSGWGADSRF